MGKILQVTDPTGTYGFTYDNMGRMVSTTTTYSFLSNNTFTNSYTYDAASNRTGYTAPDGSTNTYTYDTLNRLSNLANSWAGSFGFTYDALSRRTRMTRPNGVNTNYSYDSLSRLLSVLHQTGGSTIDGAVYTLDAVGNRASKSDQFAGVTSNYTYDALYELTQVTQGTNTTESYSYDPVGNRITSQGVSSYTYDASNELGGAGGVTYTYDNNGNRSARTDANGTTSYAWDFDNRLVSVTLPGTGGVVSFKYDSFGRRIYKQSQNGTAIFLYDGANLIETASAAGTEVIGYMQSANMDEPLAAKATSGTDYYEADGLGSVTSLTGPSGAVAQTYAYDSFGNGTASSGSQPNSFRYAAREFDTETGLYFYRARYYDTSAGRFLSEDALDPVNRSNPYPYVSNNPVNYTDPSGFYSVSYIVNLHPLNCAWWDFTCWYYGDTAFSTKLDVKCVCVGNGFQRRVALTAKFDVTYVPSALSHEQEHIGIAETALSSAAPQFDALEKVTFPTLEACKKAIGEVGNLLNQVISKMNSAQNAPEPWILRTLRKIF